MSLRVLQREKKGSCRERERTSIRLHSYIFGMSLPASLSLSLVSCAKEELEDVDVANRDSRVWRGRLLALCSLRYFNFFYLV